MNHTVLITGGSAGLGLATAERIARDHSHRVIIACRSPERATSTASTIVARTGNRLVEGRALDLASLDSVRAFACSWREPIDALVLNAGVQVVTGHSKTVDGFETTFAVNHLGQFLLANLLLPRMRDDGRIVFVASDAHDSARISFLPSPRFEDPAILATGGSERDASPGKAGRTRYTTSKLCNVLSAYEMDRRLRSRKLCGGGDRIAVNAFDPGFMPNTDLGRDYRLLARIVRRYVLQVLPLIVANANRVSTSAGRLAAVAVGASFAGITGRYVSRGRVTRSSVESYDEDKARLLWDESMRLVSLRTS
jgi:NAD(P)-dependent dehydrogenase (short-subunit alcohol dehydrogenase family)